MNIYTRSRAATTLFAEHGLLERRLRPSEHLHEIPATRLALCRTDADLGDFRRQHVTAMAAGMFPVFHHRGRRIAMSALKTDVLRGTRECVATLLDAIFEVVAVQH